MTMVPGIAAHSQFQAALLVSLVVHVALSAMTPSAVAPFDKSSVLPLTVRLTQREVMPVTQQAPSRPKSGADHPAPIAENTRPAPTLVQSGLPNLFAPPVATPVDQGALQSPVALEFLTADQGDFPVSADCGSRYEGRRRAGG